MTDAAAATAGARGRAGSRAAPATAATPTKPTRPTPPATPAAEPPSEHRRRSERSRATACLPPTCISTARPPGPSMRFSPFSTGPARSADALYLLGDLFEVWVGDDDDNPDNARACAGLARLTRQRRCGVRAAWQPRLSAGRSVRATHRRQTTAGPGADRPVRRAHAAQSRRRVLHRGHVLPGAAQHRAQARLAAALSVVAARRATRSRERRARRQQGAYRSEPSRPSWT